MKLATSALLCLMLAGCVVATGDGAYTKSGSGTTTVCHKGNKTMELPEDAVPAHLHHGDHPGPC